MNSTIAPDAAPGPEWLGIDMTPIFSPFYWGTVCSLILSGITIMQAWIYFPSKDRAFVQFTAVLMIMLDLASTGLVSQGMYHYFVPNFGSLVPLGSLTPPLAAECYVSVMIILMSHMYFTWQTYNVLPKGATRYAVTAFVFFWSMVAFGGGLACSTVMFTRNHDILTNRSGLFKILVGISKGAASIADIGATAAMCWSLTLSTTGIKQTDVLLKTLTQYIIERGLLVSSIQTLILLIFFIKPDHTYWLALHPNVTRLYANTFFAMLNGRKSLTKTNQASFMSMSTGSTTAQAQSFGSRPHRSQKYGQYQSQTDSVDEEKGFGAPRVEKTIVIANI